MSDTALHQAVLDWRGYMVAAVRGEYPIGHTFPTIGRAHDKTLLEHPTTIVALSTFQEWDEQNKFVKSLSGKKYTHSGNRDYNFYRVVAE